MSSFENRINKSKREETNRNIAELKASMSALETRIVTWQTINEHNPDSFRNQGVQFPTAQTTQLILKRTFIPLIHGNDCETVVFTILYFQRFGLSLRKAINCEWKRLGEATNKSSGQAVFSPRGDQASELSELVRFFSTGGASFA